MSDVYLRAVKSHDEQELVSGNRDSENFHEPWISPPRSRTAFRRYLDRLGRDDHQGYLVCKTGNNTIAGVINVNNMVMGSFRSATLGYYAIGQHRNTGMMRRGLELLCTHAFQTVTLHRLEANIQPENSASIELVKRCGFSYEGLSKYFLHINGEWRHHERWALVNSRTALLP